MHKQWEKKKKVLFFTSHPWVMFRHFLGSRTTARGEVSPKDKHYKQQMPPLYTPLFFYLLYLSWCHMLWDTSLDIFCQLTWLCPLPGSCPPPAPWWGNVGRQRWCSASPAQQQPNAGVLPTPFQLPAQSTALWGLQWERAQVLCLGLF